MVNLIVLFGLPGSGKSYLAKILKEKHDFIIFDGDDCLPQDMKQALFQRQLISEEMRQRFNQAMLTKLAQLYKKTKKLVFMQTLLKDDFRQTIFVKYPSANFLLVTSDENIRELRYQKRQSFNLGLDYLRKICQIFESISVPHSKIDNTNEGEKGIIQQLNKII